MAASSYNYPGDFIYWADHLKEGKIGVYTTKGDDGTLAGDGGKLKAIDETVAKAVMMVCDVSLEPIEKDDDYPDIDPSLHVNLVDYIKYRLLQDSIMRGEGDFEMGQLKLATSRNLWRSWEDALKRFSFYESKKSSNTVIRLPKV